jgi:hypothetical protein
MNTYFIRRHTFAVFILSFLLATINAGIVSIDGMRLLPFEFTYNYRFVFSDRLPEPEENQAQLPLEKAYANVNLKLKPIYHNATNNNSEYRLFVMLGDRETLGGIIVPLEIARKEGKLNNAKQIEKVIDEHASNLAIYGVMTVSQANDTYRY